MIEIVNNIGASLTSLELPEIDYNFRDRGRDQMLNADRKQKIN
jgi:hypothetical protein